MWHCLLLCCAGWVHRLLGTQKIYTRYARPALSMLLLLSSHELIATMQSVVTGQAPITLEWRITLGGERIQQKIKHTIKRPFIMQDYFRFKNGTFHKRQKKSAIDSKRCSFITEYFELQFDTATLTIPSFRMIKATFQTKVQTRTISFSFVICFCFVSSLLLSSSTRRRF